MHNFAESLRGGEALMNQSEVAEALPQKGRANCLDEFLEFSTTQGISVSRSFIRHDSHMLLEAREKIGKAPKSVEDFQVKANFPATAVEFLGHFTAPAPVILPGHEILGYAHCLLMVHLNLPINITRISAKFKRAVVPGDNLRFVFNSFKLVGPIICCHVEISDESNNIVCEIRALEGRMLSYDKHCAFHWLIETACQAATLTQFYAEGRLEEPIALTAVEMSFTRLPLPGETVYAAVHKMTHKRGIDSCEADLTDQYGRHLARASSLNGINVSKLGIC